MPYAKARRAPLEQVYLLLGIISERPAMAVALPVLERVAHETRIGADALLAEAIAARRGDPLTPEEWLERHGLAEAEAKRRRRPGRPVREDAEEFARLYNDPDLSLIEIARHKGISVSAVSARARRHGLPARGKGGGRKRRDAAE